MAKWKRDELMALVVSALEKVEWVPYVVEGKVAYKCPWCHAGRGTGHTLDCARQRALEGAGDEKA
jgi:hypothetical protein